MWADRAWVGRYFPPGLPAGRELEAYGQWCNAVEGNTTFYAVPAADAVARWADQAPEGFRFALKLPRTITHDRRLRDADAELRGFLDRVDPLRAVMGPTSIQLPASFEPEDLPVLERFLRSLPTDWKWGVEVRHIDFCDGDEVEQELIAILARHGVERVIIDTRAFFDGPVVTPQEREAFERKPRLPVRAVAIGDTPVVRFVGQTAASANPGYWKRWVTTVAGWLNEGRRPIFFIHTPDNAESLDLCRQFHAEVAAKVPALTKLADPLAPLPGMEEQLDLF